MKIGFFRFHYNYWNHILKGKVLSTSVSFALGDEPIKQVTKSVVNLRSPNIQSSVYHTDFIYYSPFHFRHM